jgi:MFS transporter, DHA2 family, multidrug resistance protein
LTSTTATVAGPRAGRREWIGMAVLALPTLLLALDMSVLYLALPHLSADLGADSTQQLWIMDIYGFMIAGFLITMGTLGDRIGRRRLLLIGASAFGAASVAAAYAASPVMLIATRALLGVAGATLMPSTLALISNMFRDARQRGLAIAVWMSCFMGGTAVGPIVGGVLLEHFWWGSAFLLGVPVMALLLVAAPLLLPEFRDPHAGRLDLASVALSLATMLPVIYGLKETARGDWQVLPVVAIVAGVASGIVFVRRQRRLADPLLDLRLFTNRAFSAALSIMLVAGAVGGGTGLLFSLDLQMVHGFSPLRAGLWQLPSVLAMIVATMLAPVLARRIRPQTVIAVGLLVAAGGYLLVTQVPATGGVAVLVVGLVIATAGAGVGMPLTTGLVLGAAPPEKAGSASALSETSGELGIALGVAVLGSLATVAYRGQITIPDGVPSVAADTARESIAGAVATAQSLPAGLGEDLLQGAREAFTTGLQVVAGFNAVVLVALAALTVTVLSSLRPIGQGEPDSAQAAAAADRHPTSAPEHTAA